MPLGPGADELDDFLRTADISSGVIGRKSLKGGSRRGAGGEGRGGKKWESRVEFMSEGVVALSKRGNVSGALPETIFFASHTDWESTLARN